MTIFANNLFKKKVKKQQIFTKINKLLVTSQMPLDSVYLELAATASAPASAPAPAPDLPNCRPTCLQGKKVLRCGNA